MREGKIYKQFLLIAAIIKYKFLRSKVCIIVTQQENKKGIPFRRTTKTILLFQTFQDIRSKIKKQKAAVVKYQNGTGGGPPPPPKWLEQSSVEKKMLSMVSDLSVTGHTNAKESTVEFVSTILLCN